MSSAHSVETEEGWFSPDPNARLYTKTWTPPSGTNIKARLAFVHGFSDHCNRYYNFFPALATRGIAVHAFDQRGWGRSVLKKAQRGDTGDTSVVLADIRSFLNHVAAATKNATEGQSTPLFLMGHSMGGGEVLLLSLLKQQPHAVPPMSGLLLESPFIDFDPAAKPDGFTVFAGKLASKVLPKHHMVQKLEPKNICRDPEVCRNWEADELCHDTGTLEGLAALVQRSADLTALATGKPVEGLGLTPVLGPEPVAVWIGHGTGDLVTSCPRSQSMFDKLQAKDKTLKLYEGAYHVLHAEPNGVAEEYTDDVANWILGRTEAGREGKEDSNDIRPKL